jgi:uncharacterized protein
VTPVEGLAIFAAGVAAGGINAVVGSGSLITFPVLVALGFPPVVANVSNNIGLVPGNAAGTYGYRRELKGQWHRFARLIPAAVTGALIGAILLLTVPQAFGVVVPVLIVLACTLVLLQPRINARLARRTEPKGDSALVHGGLVLWFGVVGSAVYGGYFGAAQGVIMMGLLAIFYDQDLQRSNGVKNLLTMFINGAAALVFIVAAHPDWLIVVLIAVGSTVGGTLGASVGRRLPPVVLRVIIVIVGVVAIVKLLLT